MLVNKNDYAAAHGIDADAGRLPCHHRLRPLGFLPGQRHARRLLRRNGASPAPARTSACSSIYGTDLADLNTYFKNVGQTNNVPITLLSTDGTSTSCVDIRPAAVATTPSRPST